jgi:predicted alpha/beta hydrolase family esterase
MSLPILLIADAPTTDPEDWMRRWAGALPDASMLMLGTPSWSDPAQWPDAIAREVAAAGGRTIIVARGRACDAVGEAAQRLRLGCGAAIAGAMLVAPLPIDDGSYAKPDLPLACPTVFVSSRLAAAPDAARVLALARANGNRCVDGGDIGDIGAADESAKLGDWGHGRHVLNWLIASISDDIASPVSTACQGNVVDFAASRSAAR